MPLDAIAACVQAVETVAGEHVCIHRIDLDLLAQRADCTAREERDAWRASRFRFERDRRRAASQLAAIGVEGEVLEQIPHRKIVNEGNGDGSVSASPRRRAGRPAAFDAVIARSP